MSKFQIINFNQQTNKERENKTMNTSVIALPAELDQIMKTIQVCKPNLGTNFVKKNGPKVPMGPKQRPLGASKAHTRYTKEFIEVIVNFLYNDLLSFDQIADILNHYGMKSAFKRDFTANMVRHVVTNDLAWSIIEPRWIQWQLDNAEHINIQG